MKQNNWTSSCTGCEHMCTHLIEIEQRVVKWFENVNNTHTHADAHINMQLCISINLSHLYLCACDSVKRVCHTVRFAWWNHLTIQFYVFFSTGGSFANNKRIILSFRFNFALVLFIVLFFRRDLYHASIATHKTNFQDKANFSSTAIWARLRADFHSWQFVKWQ